MHSMWKAMFVVVLLCMTPAMLPAADNAKAASLAGPWLGTLKVPPSTELRIVFNITAKPDGSLSATLDSPDQGATGAPVRCPVLAINGSLDMQVAAKQNLSAIEQALREGKNPDFTVKELPGLNHLFQTAKTGAADEYARIEETVSPLALETVATWVESHARQQ